MPLFYLTALLFLQSDVPLKANREFEIITKYELRKKPDHDPNKIVFEAHEEKQRSSGTDMLPFLSIKVKVKKWTEGVTILKIADVNGKVYLKKKANDDGLYDLELGFVDDIKDHVTPGKFRVQFLKEKKPIEQITIEVEADGTFLVNGEKRGKF